MPAAVLHLLGTAQPEGSGIARIVAALAGGLDPAQYQVHAWFLGPSGPLVEELEAAGVATRSIGWWRGARDPVGAYRFRQSLVENDFAIVHQHFGSRSIRRIVRLSSRARLVVHLHAGPFEPPSEKGVPLAIRGADLVIAVSHAVALGVRSAEPSVIHVVPNGVHARAGFRERDNGHATTTVIGTACRLIPLKGVVDLIRAVALIAPEFPSLTLEIAGGGPQREELEKEVARLGLTGRVHFLGWQRDLGPVLRNWDIFATASRNEGFGLAALEAMAEGLPVVATAVGGLLEVVDDGQTGYLVAPLDVLALAERLRLLMLDPSLRRSMGTAGLQRAGTHFSVDRMVAKIGAIYDSLTAGNQHS